MLTTAALFLIQTIFDLYIFVVMLRFLLQTLHADYFNPLAQFSIKFTQWIVKPLQKIIPEIKGIDLAIVFLLLALEIIKLLLLFAIEFQGIPHIGGILLFCVASLLGKLLTFYFYAIIIRVIISLVAPNPRNPIFFTLYQLTEPVLRPLRRVIPAIGGFDLSPLLAMILTQLLSLVIISPLTQLALHFF
jgi:YggT family protein